MLALFNSFTKDIHSSHIKSQNRLCDCQDKEKTSLLKAAHDQQLVSCQWCQSVSHHHHHHHHLFAQTEQYKLQM